MLRALIRQMSAACKCYRVRELKGRCTGDPVTRCKADGDCAAAGGTCYLGLPKGVQADLLDAFEHKAFEVTRPTLFCLPADQDGAGIRNPAAHLTGYRIASPRSGPSHVRVPGIHLNDRDYGPEVVTTIKEELLLVPSFLDAPGSPSGGLTGWDRCASAARRFALSVAARGRRPRPSCRRAGAGSRPAARAAPRGSASPPGRDAATPRRCDPAR